VREHGVPYQVVGGLAARAYGAHRPLADIDLYVPLDRAAGLLQEIRPFVSWGPKHYVDEAWDISFLKADYYGQWVELGDSSSVPRFYNKKGGRWETQWIDYANSASVSVFGVEIEAMPKCDLIRYKSSLGREVDMIDIKQMTDAGLSGDRG